MDVEFKNRCDICGNADGRNREYYAGSGCLCSECFSEYLIIELPSYIPTEQIIRYCIEKVKKNHEYKT